MHELIKFIDGARRRMITALRGVTLGVRAIVTDADGNVLLVRHTYRSQWYTPGGAVNAGEGPLTALKRELHEELALIIEDRKSTFHCAYVSHYRGGHDYALFYHVSANPDEVRLNDTKEIAEIGWFAPDALPTDVSPRTARLIDDFKKGVVGDECWL